MWQPTHLQVTVQRAKGLNFKGKNDTNDAFVVISLGKEKFQTSVKEKATNPVEWHEECELAIPTHGNTASVQLTVYHRNALGLDEFLGQIQLPLNEYDVYERPKNRWHRLKGKPEKDKKKGEKERGELEAKIAFTVKSGSLSDISKKEKDKLKTSLTSLKHLGHKIDKVAKKPRFKGRKSSQDSQGFPQEHLPSRQHYGDADPGVISDSDDEKFGFDEEVQVATGSSSPYSTVSRGSSYIHEEEPEQGGDFFRRNNSLPIGPSSKPPPKPARLGSDLFGKVVGSAENVNRVESRNNSLNTSQASSTQDIADPSTPTSRFPEIKALTLEGRGKEEEDDIKEAKEKKKRGKKDGFKGKFFRGGGSRERLGEEDGRVVEGGNDKLPLAPTQRQSRLPQEIHDKFSGKTREDLLEMIVGLQANVEKHAKHTRDLEDYIDDLLLRVMEATPHILQAPICRSKEINLFGAR